VLLLHTGRTGRPWSRSSGSRPLRSRSQRSSAGGGRDFARTKKFRNVRANSKVALVIDDVLPPWRPRCVMVRGQAEALEEATSADGEQLGPIIRIHPGQVISWGLDGAES
jgi:pyridoxamine 5'-phosphate oxidase family protein